MTISSTPRKAGPLLGNSAQTAWPFAFKVFAASDIKVTVANSVGVETDLLLGSDYSVALNANQDTSPGGTVTYPLTGSPMPYGAKLTIVGNLPYDQPLDLPSGGNFSPLALENQLDRAGMQIQQLAEQGARTLKLQVTSSTSVSTTFPAPEANKFIAWNTAATALENADIAGLATQIVYSDWKHQVFVGNGTQSQFTLDGSPSSIANMAVSIDGLVQTPNVDFTLFGNVVAFNVPPAVGAEVLVRYGASIAQLARGQVVERYPATALQTEFTLTTPYAIGQNALAVYVNGLRMEGGGIDYTETSSTVVTFTSGLAVNDVVLFVIGLDVASGGGGGGTPTPTPTVLGGFTHPTSIVIDQTTPSGRVVIADTNPLGWNVDSGRCTLQFDFLSTGYYAANPDGHWAVVTRAETAVIATAVRGQGIAVGNATGFSPPSDLNPTPMIETWMNGTVAPSGNQLYPNTDGARSKGGHKDGVLYRFIIDSSKTQDGQRYVRYRMWAWDAAREKWDAEVDSGDILDANVWADLQQSGIVFGHVFPSNLSPWSLTFSNVKCTWGPAESAVPDQSIKLSRFGAELEGNLRFLGSARRIRTRNNYASFADWTLFQSADDDTGTRVGAAPPSGGSTTEWVALSNTGANAQALSFGVEAGRGVIRSYRFGSAPAHPIDIWLDGAAQFTFKSTGMTLKGATVDLCAPLGSMTGVYNWDNTPAKSFATSPFSFDMESLCTLGALTSFLGGTYSAGNIENALRPIYCIVANLVDALYDRRVFTYS